MKKWIVIVITVCIVISLIAFINTTDIGKVIDSVQKIGYKFIWLLLLTGIAYYFATISWQYCLGDQYRSISTFRLFLIRHVCETVGLFNPASVVGGDALKAVMLANHGIENKRVVASIILSRLILIATQLSFFLVTVLALFMHSSGFKHADANEKVNSWLPFILTKTRTLRLKSASFLKEIPTLFRENKRAIAWSVVFALLHWIFGALEFYFILNFLGIEVSILHAFFIDLGVIFFKTAGAFIPGQIGVEEYGNKIMLMAIGIHDAEIWISASILRRARQLVWIAVGIVIYFLLVKKRNIFQKE